MIQTGGGKGEMREKRDREWHARNAPSWTQTGDAAVHGQRPNPSAAMVPLNLESLMFIQALGVLQLQVTEHYVGRKLMGLLLTEPFQMPKISPSTLPLYVISRLCRVSHFTVHLQMRTSLDIWQEMAQRRETPIYLILITLLQCSFRPHVVQKNVITEQAWIILHECVQDILAITTKYPYLGKKLNMSEPWLTYSTVCFLSTDYRTQLRAHKYLCVYRFGALY